MLKYKSIDPQIMTNRRLTLFCALPFVGLFASMARAQNAPDPVISEPPINTRNPAFHEELTITSGGAPTTIVIPAKAEPHLLPIGARRDRAIKPTHFVIPRKWESICCCATPMIQS